MFPRLWDISRRVCRRRSRCEGRLRHSGERGALTIPRDAITRQADGSALVWVIVDQDGRTVAAPRRVELGRPLGDAVEVAAGLDASARVVVRGNELLREGREVRVLGP